MSDWWKLRDTHDLAFLMFAYHSALSRYEDNILDAAGDEAAQDAWEYDRITGDYYDESIEFKGCGNDVRLNEDQQRITFDSGFQQCWLNHKDGTETFYSWGRKASGAEFKASEGNHYMPTRAVIKPCSPLTPKEKP